MTEPGPETTPATEGLTVGKHCEMLAANARHRTDSMAAWFKLFLQLYSAIVGGAVALRLQASHNNVPLDRFDVPLDRFECLSDLLVIFLGVASAALVIGARVAEHGHRKRLTEIAGKDENNKDIVPAPGLWQWTGCVVMVAVIVFAAIGFVCLNPLAQ